MERNLNRLTRNAAGHTYKNGDLLFGEAGGALLGVSTDRHAVTVGGSRAGKGVGVIIPNLRLWPHSALVIDPKGEAATATASDRQKMGQAVHVLDPFGRARIPDSLRATYNPLDALNINTATIKEDIETIADGIVMRADASASHWDDNAAALIAGMIAYVLASDSFKTGERNLLTVRSFLRDKGRLKDAYHGMSSIDATSPIADLARAGARVMEAEESEYFFSNAEKNTRWLDSRPMQDALKVSTFSLRELKESKATVFLVLPSNYLGQHGRFLRLFVRCGIDAMAQPMPDGSDQGERCLFLLDEFAALGFINEIATSAGLMGGYGLHLWPFLQDVGQLQKLYGREGAETFFGNADLHQFFGNMDGLTLELISRRLGVHDETDLPPEPPQAGVTGILDHFDGRTATPSQWLAQGIGRQQYDETNKLGQLYDRTAGRLIGRPRFSPEQIAEAVRKPAPKEIAVGQICFTHGLKPIYCKLAPFWKLDELSQTNEPDFSGLVDPETDLDRVKRENQAREENRERNFQETLKEDAKRGARRNLKYHYRNQEIELVAATVMIPFLAYCAVIIVAIFVPSLQFWFWPILIISEIGVTIHLFRKWKHHIWSKRRTLHTARTGIYQ